jgi:hypothetical protein
MIKQVVTTLRMTPVFDPVSIPFVSRFVDDDGRIEANEPMEYAAGAMRDEPARVEAALRPLRAGD